jgi:hypothetical protein
MTTTERAVAGIAVLLAALGVALIVAGARSIVGQRDTLYDQIHYVIAQRDAARLRADMLEVVAAEKWVTTTGKACRCGLCGGKWQAGKKANHGERCVLATPEWRAR